MKIPVKYTPQLAMIKINIVRPVIIPTISKYSLSPTDNPDLFRVINRNGDWIVYFNSKEKKYKWAVNYIISNGFPMADGLINFIKNHTSEESKKILESAGERGSRVHAAIRDLINGLTIDLERPYESEIAGKWERLTDEEWSCLTAWVAWVEKFKPELISCETSVDAEKYAGTIDFLGSINLQKGDKININDSITTIKEDKKIKVLLDWKTGSGIYDNYRLQVAAYAFASKIIPEYTGIIRLGTAHKNGRFEMKLWDYETTKFHYQKFRASLSNFELNHKEYIHEDGQIPTQLAVKIPKIERK